MVRDTKADDFCRTVSNFSLEYRTTRQTILQQRERERQKSGAESPGPHTPAARRKNQATPAQVSISGHSESEVPLWNNRIDLSIRYLLIHQENQEQLRLEEVLKTPEPTRRLDSSLPRHRRRMAMSTKVLSVSHTCLDKMPPGVSPLQS